MKNNTKKKKTMPVMKKRPTKKKKEKSNGGSVPAASSSEKEIRQSNLASRENLDAFQHALKNLSIQNYPRLRFDVGTRVEFRYTDRSKNESHEITGTVSAHW